MPNLRVSPEEERDRAILGQISQKTWLKYGKKMSARESGISSGWKGRQH